MSIINTIQNCAEKKYKVFYLKPYQLLITHRIVEQFNTDEEENQIVILPTGSGKSLCFLIPAAISKKTTIIIYPLLALMNDQISKLNKLNIKSAVLKGGQTKQERDEIFKKLENDTHIVITNPETLNQKRIIDKFKKLQIEMLVVDEAHCISTWGKDFRPAYKELKNTIKQLQPHQIIAFTATATAQTIFDIEDVLFQTKPIIVRADTDRDNIYYSAYPVYSKTQGLAELLKSCKKPVIVFCGKRRSTYEQCFLLKRIYPEYNMRYYHAGLTKEERTTIEKWFRNTADAVLFTTCAYGMGIDHPGIRTVIHYDVPEDSLEYLQESGRAGRDRQPATAWVLVPYGQEKYEGLLDIFTKQQCRRQSLLETLGEYKEECSGCDFCSKQIIRYPKGHKLIKTFIALNPFRFSVNTAAGILCGNPFYRKYSSNPFYGTVKTDELLLRKTIEQMDFGKYESKGAPPRLFCKNRLFRLRAKKKNPVGSF